MLLFGGNSSRARWTLAVSPSPRSKMRLSPTRPSGTTPARNFSRILNASSAGWNICHAKRIKTRCVGRPSRSDVEKLQEEYMTKKALLTAAILVLFAAPALAEEYYVVRGPDRHCTVTTTKPKEQTTITQIGPLAFESREKAEDRIKTTTVCSDGATTGSSTTTIERK